MKITSIIFAFLFPLFLSGQCEFFPSDTVNVCGYEYDLGILLEDGTITYGCENDQFLSIDFDSPETNLAFSSCGTYELVYNAVDGSCSDTLIVQVSDPNSSIKTQNTLIDLGYGDIDCPSSVTAECGESTVSYLLTLEHPPHLVILQHHFMLFIGICL